VLNGKMCGELRIRKNVEGSNYGLICSTIFEFASEDLRKPQNTTVRIAFPRFCLDRE
jgi:hypothetical protein